MCGRGDDEEGSLLLSLPLCFESEEEEEEELCENLK